MHSQWSDVTMYIVMLSVFVLSRRITGCTTRFLQRTKPEAVWRKYLDSFLTPSFAIWKSLITSSRSGFALWNLLIAPSSYFQWLLLQIHIMWKLLLPSLTCNIMKWITGIVWLIQNYICMIVINSNYHTYYSTTPVMIHLMTLGTCKCTMYSI